MHIKATTIKRFEAKIKKAKNGCWEWNANVLNSGYGQFCFNNSKILAHRFSYLLHKGEIKNGLVVCHSCDNPICVNPTHLFTGTLSDNMRDMYSKGRYNLLSRRKPTHLPHPSIIHYTKYKCRCAECVAINRNYKRAKYHLKSTTNK